MADPAISSKLSVVPKDLLVIPENKTAAIKPIFNKEQLQRLFRPTPDSEIGLLPKGGKKIPFVSGGYMRRELDVLFGWDWSFEIVNQTEMQGEIIVQGKLTVRVDDREIVKMQFGGSKIKMDKSGKPLSIGNDAKAAATDALKKCAADFGIARDVYYTNEFIMAEITESDLVSKEEKEQESEPLSEDEVRDIQEQVDAMDVTDSMRLIKSVTGSISINPKKITDFHWRALRDAMNNKIEEE